MKKLLFLFTLSLLMSSWLLAVTAGDIAIIAMHTDSDKYLAFVALADIPANTTISFTDNAWNATTQTWRANEGTIQWANSLLTTKGTVVTLNVQSNPYTTTHGSVTYNGNFNLSKSGDQVLAYLGTAAPTTNNHAGWLYGYSSRNFAWKDDANSSDIPTALVNYSVAMTTSATDFNNSYFANGATAQTTVAVAGSKSELLVLFTDNTKYYKNNSAVSMPTYTITVSEGAQPTAAAPTFDPNGGSFINSVNVELSSETDDATIYYTTNGDTPDDHSTQYTAAINLTTTTTIKAIAYASDHEPSEVAQATFTKLEPATTTIPYTESFTSNLNGVYTYTVSGTKPWYHYNGAAVCNGYQGSGNGSGNEEHWMVLPGINFDNYTAERMTFSTTAYYGTINESNYLKLYYSTDYAGLGDPTTANWTELSFVNGGTNNQSTPSGVINLAGISGTQVFLAFKYKSTDKPTMWTVDDISIYIASPVVTVNASLNSFSYEHNAGPSEEQSFTVSGADLTGDIGITAPSNYEISTDTGATFVATSPITLTQAGGSVAQTTIYVRLKDNLAIGTYNQDISIVSDGATSQTVSCSGEVTTPTAPVAPVATAATAIGSDSFTANWDSVSGATGYRLDVYEKEVGATATDLFFSEYIEGGVNNKALEIFNGTGASVDLTAYKINLYTNGASTASVTYSLTGSLADGDVFVAAHIDATSAFTSVADYTVKGGVVNFNGDDAVALLKNDVIIDVIGVIGTREKWSVAGTANATENKTLVRKSSVQAGNTDWAAQAGTNADDSEWIVYAQDTSTYLGSHTFDGGTTLTYVTDCQNLDVGNFTNYEITGLDPETTYYYVVRVYDAYSQTSSSSNEIEVTTTAASTFDYPEDEEIDAGVVLIEITGGNGIIVSGELTPVQNPNFEVTFEQRIELTGDGPWIVTVFSEDEWVACLFDGAWMVEEVPQSGPGAGYVYFLLEFPEGKNTIIELKSGNGGNPTLPVELSTFTVALNNYNNAVLTWVTQTETGVSGFYVFRNTEESLATAEMVSNLIPATNTSQQQVYLFTDKELGGPGTYYYWLQVSDMDGSDSFYGPINVVYIGSEPQNPGAPAITTLKGIYPNPFNPSTTISYSLAKAGDVNIRIFNSRGQLVRNYQQGLQNAGNYNLIWNGQDDNGQNMSSGVYFFRMQAGDKVFSSKAVLLK